MFFNLWKNLQYCFLIISLLFIVACDSAKVKDTAKPVFTSKSRVSINENSATVITVKSTDHSNVSYSIIGGEDQEKFIISTSGQLSFKTAPNYESPTDKDKKNTYIVKIAATDSAKNIASQTIIVTVKDIDDSKPVFTSLNTKSIVEGQTDVLMVTATDESSITYSLSGGEDKSKFNLNDQTGALVFKNAPSFDSPTDVGSNNSYIVIITATDEFGNSATQTIAVHVIPTLVDMSGDYSIVHLGKGSSYENLDISLGNSEKTLYILFTNHHSTEPATPTVSHSAKKTINSLTINKLLNSDSKFELDPQIIHTPEYKRSLNADNHPFFGNQNINQVSQQKNKIALNDTQIFTTEFYPDGPDHNEGDIKATTETTLRKIIPSIDTKFGVKNLYIWVSDDSFDSTNLKYGIDCDKHNNAPNTSSEIGCVTQTLIDTLADKFLIAGENNDTYDWVTNIYGEVWGDSSDSNLIAKTNDLHILITDLFNDNNPNGGVIGLFSLENNFKKSKYAGSNEKIMLYVDSLILANDGGAGKWQKAVHSTLTHELTHMIDFYQNQVKLQKTNTKWLRETLAEATEYITSHHVQHQSPRALPYDQGDAGLKGIVDVTAPYCTYNLYNNSMSLTLPKNEPFKLEHYSNVSSFGAFLVNNYGGPKVLHDIMHSSKTDEEAVLEATNKYNGNSTDIFGDILRNWGIAVLLSDRNNLALGVPRYNTGGFTPTNYNGVDYDIGSINLFNYVKDPNAQNISDTGPSISNTMETVMPHGNFFYSVGEKLTGKVTINLNLSENIEATLIAK